MINGLLPAAFSDVVAVCRAEARRSERLRTAASSIGSSTEGIVYKTASQFDYSMQKWLTLTAGIWVGNWKVKSGNCCCCIGGCVGPANSWITDASIATRHKGHSLFCAWTFDARHCKWNLWLQDNVKSGEPNARALRQIEQSSVVFDNI